MSVPITARRMGDQEREAFLPRHIPVDFWRFEQIVYSVIDRASEDYGGGFWDFYELSNGGFYMAPAWSPDGKNTFAMVWPDNDFEGELSADAAGIAVTLMVLGNLSFGPRGEQRAEKFHLLRDFAFDHPEAVAVFGFID